MRFITNEKYNFLNGNSFFVVNSTLNKTVKHGGKVKFKRKKRLTQSQRNLPHGKFQVLRFLKSPNRISCQFGTRNCCVTLNKHSPSLRHVEFLFWFLIDCAVNNENHAKAPRRRYTAAAPFTSANDCQTGGTGRGRSFIAGSGAVISQSHYSLTPTHPLDPNFAANLITLRSGQL